MSTLIERLDHLAELASKPNLLHTASDAGSELRAMDQLTLTSNEGPESISIGFRVSQHKRPTTQASTFLINYIEIPKGAMVLSHGGVKKILEGGKYTIVYPIDTAPLYDAIRYEVQTIPPDNSTAVEPVTSVTMDAVERICRSKDSFRRAIRFLSDHSNAPVWKKKMLESNARKQILAYSLHFQLPAKYYIRDPEGNEMNFEHFEDDRTRDGHLGIGGEYIVIPPYTNFYSRLPMVENMVAKDLFLITCQGKMKVAHYPDSSVEDLTKTSKTYNGGFYTFDIIKKSMYRARVKKVFDGKVDDEEDLLGPLVFWEDEHVKNVRQADAAPFQNHGVADDDDLLYLNEYYGSYEYMNTGPSNAASNRFDNQAFADNVLASHWDQDTQNDQYLQSSESDSDLMV
ncbi:hypothetical protein F4806DRAFT_506132 [Annulohypoxylon nitens]|nr:hypothetical protein F4806DRAFT_506132 [Annulohypoxylon nitens]